LYKTCQPSYSLPAESAGVCNEKKRSAYLLQNGECAFSFGHANFLAETPKEKQFTLQFTSDQDCEADKKFNFEVVGKCAEEGTADKWSTTRNKKCDVQLRVTSE